MSDQTLPFPHRIESPSGLSTQVNANGSIRRMDHGDIMLNLFPGTEVEGAPANLYLRRHGNVIESLPLLGPSSKSAVQGNERGFAASGVCRGLRYNVSLVLADSAPAWFWHVSLENVGDGHEALDLIHSQDLALAHYGAVRLNEYYVSQYLDHALLSHPQRGVVLASRQNQPMGGRNPWCVIGSLGQGVSFATDALQFCGLAGRAGRAPVGVTEGLPGARRQHEHAMAAIQEAPLHLAPGEKAERGFFGWFEADHPAATSNADLVFVDKALALPEASYPLSPEERTGVKGYQTTTTLFSPALLHDALDLTEAEIADLLGPEQRHPERDDAGRLLSFFTGTRSHVVLKAKELQVLRPHGHILRSGGGVVPDEAGLTSTVWMAGVFHSMVTQGHVSINRFLSTTHSYLSLFRSHGQRVFMESAEGWRLLDIPSAFEIRPEGCRWIYKLESGLIEVRSEALTEGHELTLAVNVLAGPPLRFLVSNHVAINGDDGAEAMPVRFARDGESVFVRPVPNCDLGWRFPDGGFRLDPLSGTRLERVGGDELLFLDGRSRNQPFLCLITARASSIGFRITGHLVPPTEMAGQNADSYWNEMTAALRVHPPAGSPLAEDVARLAEILPWLAHNALIHYLAPRGLEQYSGGGWGTRDVAQGPVEMLLALGHFEPVRDLLIRVFGNQNPDGDWPQWFMFFDRERNIRPGDSHGDIAFWPVLALSQYLVASEDASLLDEAVPFFHPEGSGKAELASVWEHVERALGVIESRMIPGTRLAAYGNGDWNDSLQPVDPSMRERLCSAWTVTLHYQTLTTLAAALQCVNRAGLAARFDAMAKQVLGDFQRILVVDDTVAGFARFDDGGRIEHLLHPRDRSTGLSYSLLPMVHAITNGMLTKEQAETHLDHIRQHLLGPDGARLFDRPLQYRGGPQHLFQRAESSSFFGREIGLMYTHAHLRYAEALARYGDAEGFFDALRKANPIGLREWVPMASLRQENCYYSSSDAAFADRYQSFAEYDRLMKGEVGLDGGWRVYSSGAGIGLSLILRALFGLRQEKSRVIIDPVIPPALEGLRIELELAGKMVEVIYRIGHRGYGPTAVHLNGTDLAIIRGSNPYRTGAAEVPIAAVMENLRGDKNRLTVWLG